MKRATLSFSGVAIAVCLATPARAQSPATLAADVVSVAPYRAVIDRLPHAKPALPPLGPAGSSIVDPVFGSRVIRMTDGLTRPGALGRSYRSPSSPHQNAWSAAGTKFYVVSGDGSVIPFSFDATTGLAQRIQPTTTGDGGLVLRFYIEPEFSSVDDSLIYGSVSGIAGATLRTIDQYNFTTGTYSRLLDLDAIVPGLSGTYIGGVASSAGPVERVMAFFGGTSQDRHHRVVLFDRANPQNRLLLDTLASTLNGAPLSIPLNFSLHHVAMDRSGRYVMLYTTWADQSGTRKAAQSYLWDTASGVFTELGVAALPYGHDALGYGVSVNQDCCVSTSWDAAQWQLRILSTPLQTRDLITNVLLPKQIYLADHPTWNNARGNQLVPFISGIFRAPTSDTEWRAWDDEIIAVQTDAAPGADATVWRFAHHRTDVRADNNALGVSFWYEPRPNVSRDGRWVMFTSNWEKTLGTDPTGDSTTRARQDVFVVELKPSSEPPAPPPPPSDPLPSLVPSTLTASPGTSVTVTLANGFGGSGDWISFAAAGSPNSSYQTFTYVGAGVTTRTWSVVAPSAPGTYEFRLFRDNSYTIAAASAPVVVDVAQSPVPAIASLTPASAPAGNPSFTLTVNGTGFVAASVVLWNGVPRATTFVSSTQLRAAIAAADIAAVGQSAVTVSTPAPGGGFSSAVAFAATPPPALTVSATSVAPGASVTMTLTNGTGGPQAWLALAPTSAANGSYVTFTYVGGGVTSRTWTVTMPSTAAAYEFRLFLDNGYTRVATSPTVTVSTAINTVPTLQSLNPARVSAGMGPLTLSVTGTGFVPGSVVLWNGSSRPTTYVSATQLRAAIPAADVATPATAQVTISSPAPGGGTSAPLPVIVAPPPSLTVSASTVAPGETVTVTLSNGVGGFYDWLSFAPVSAGNTSYLTFVYIGGGTTTRTWTVTAPSTPGTYEFRLFLNNSYTRTATSPPVTVR
jgi:hypothetical protein